MCVCVQIGLRQHLCVSRTSYHCERKETSSTRMAPCIMIMHCICVKWEEGEEGWGNDSVLFALIRKEKRYFGRIATAFSEYGIADLEHWRNTRAASEHADMANLLRCDATALRFFETDLELAISLYVCFVFYRIQSHTYETQTLAISSAIDTIL